MCRPRHFNLDYYSIGWGSLLISWFFRLLLKSLLNKVTSRTFLFLHRFSLQLISRPIWSMYTVQCTVYSGSLKWYLTEVNQNIHKSIHIKHFTINIWLSWIIEYSMYLTSTVVIRRSGKYFFYHHAGWVFYTYPPAWWSIPYTPTLY